MILGLMDCKLIFMSDLYLMKFEPKSKLPESQPKRGYTGKEWGLHNCIIFMMWKLLLHNQNSQPKIIKLSHSYAKQF